MRRGTRSIAAVATCVAVSIAGLALAGCGEVNPGAAATVDGESIPLDEVDTTARAFCAAELVIQEQAGDPLFAETTAAYRNEVLGTLINLELADQLRAELGVDVPPASYGTDLSQFDDLFAELSAEDETALRDYVADFNRLQAITQAIALEQDDSQTLQDPQTAIDDGYLVELANTDIELDPRFGELDGGLVVGGSGSLSVPATTEGEPRRGQQAADEPVPASQTCA